MRNMAKPKPTVATAVELAEQNREEIRSLIRYINEIQHHKISDLENTVKKLEARLGTQSEPIKFDFTLTDDENSLAESFEMNELTPRKTKH